MSYIDQIVQEKGVDGHVIDVVKAHRDVPTSHGKDLYAGQVCFVRKSMLFDGIHAVRYRGKKVVCRLQVVPGGRLLLSWHNFKEDGVLVERSRVEHIGAVIGFYSNDCDPVLWMHSN